MPRRRACGAGPDYAPVYTDTLELDMGEVVPSISGPKRPQDRVPLAEAKADSPSDGQPTSSKGGTSQAVPVEGEDYDLGHGDVVIAAITSCTNTSNPYVMIGAGLLARKAARWG
ncbi:MAG: hypothetical protein KatS3mg118_1539 [Paracoccaceae bacterium]|nr:MAG: hypothetical protein KatS3mg118_1539 [Paracoccaceae bacterium]